MDYDNNPGSHGSAEQDTPGHDSAPGTGADHTDTDTDGLIETRVEGVDAKIYAHRSNVTPGTLLVGVDAPQGQSIRFVVNDGDMLDTTVGVDAGELVTLPSTEQFTSNAHRMVVGGESRAATAVATRVEYLVPDDVIAQGSDAVAGWVEQTARAVAVTSPVRISVEIGERSETCLTRAIWTGRKLLDTERSFGDSRSETEAASDAIANILLALADSDGFEEVVSALRSARMYVRDEWAEADRIVPDCFLIS
ncbi:hypothetical protein [Rhodococcus sp. NJ-530]|uniref:hypothetical protein n=1 Tax=Rhodococcus sp. NJ-530 TaxID=2490853 RepID=UPI000F618C08|nr:hypothetical protein [Rhodococcus sp. NJ-530]AZI65554.1 hypothetical protein EHW12_31025 [Rhodococcus sp. NJ-530]